MARKKRNYKGRDFTPARLAVYLMDKDPLYVTFSARKIKKVCPELGIGIQKICDLKKDPQYEQTVLEQYKKNIANKKNLEVVFWSYLEKVIEANLKQPQPSTKPLDILGFITGLYNPKQTGDVHVNITNEQKKTVDNFLNRVLRKHENKN
jgi:hypothetical protein